MPAGLLVLALTIFFLGRILVDVVVLRFFTIDETTLTLFKLFLDDRGIDLKSIPDAVLIEIAAIKTEEAKQMTAAHDTVSPTSKSWNCHLARLLSEEADRIEMVIRDGPEKHLGHVSTRALLKYGVVEPLDVPTMTIDEFVEAAKDGTLHAELGRRLSLRA